MIILSFSRWCVLALAGHKPLNPIIQLPQRCLSALLIPNLKELHPNLMRCRLHLFELLCCDEQYVFYTVAWDAVGNSQNVERPHCVHALQHVTQLVPRGRSTCGSESRGLSHLPWATIVGKRAPMTCAVSHHERPAIELDSSMMRTVSKVVKGVGVFCNSGRGVGSEKGAGGKGPNDGARCPAVGV